MEPTVEEITAAIRTLKNNKAPGSDEIPAEVYKQEGASLMRTLHGLFLRIWGTEEDFKDSIIVPIYKKKGDRSDCKNYRGISLLSVAGKILTRIIVNRLTRVIANNILPESQCGFRQRRGTDDMIFAARQVQENCREQQMDLYTVFIDLTKAFDTVSREGLWQLLHKFAQSS